MLFDVVDAKPDNDGDRDPIVTLVTFTSCFQRNSEYGTLFYNCNDQDVI